MSRVPHNLEIFCKGSATAKSLRITGLVVRAVKFINMPYFGAR